MSKQSAERDNVSESFKQFLFFRACGSIDSISTSNTSDDLN